jgi:hypothetical protein
MRSRNPIEATGRLGAFTLLGAAAGSIPLPWLPGRLTRRVRGALVFDLAARRGLSLSPSARTILAEPNRSERGSRATREAIRYLAVRMLGRFGPVQFLSPFRAALGTFVLGHLFARYLATRDESGSRIEEDEALFVREIIDKALLHALTAAASGEHESFDPPTEDSRDEVTQAVDGVILATAGVPAWLVHRLEAAFDDMLSQRRAHE